MRPGLNLAISTIRAWNDIGPQPRLVAPHNSTRTQIVFHNPGCVDVLVAPIVVVHDPDGLQWPQPAVGGSPWPDQPRPQSWPYDWPYTPDQQRSLPVTFAPPARLPFDSPPTQVSNRPLLPSLARRGGCILIYANGGDCVISGNVTMAWQAFAADEPGPCCGQGCMTVVAAAPPVCPLPGQLWWSTQDGQLYVWTGNEWVAASCCACGEGTMVPPGPVLPGPPQPPFIGHPLTVIELT